MTDSTTQKDIKTICFAYFGDGKFLGWYSDSFGTLTSDRPKLYSYSKEQISTIKRNFSYNIANLKTKSTLASDSKEYIEGLDAESIKNLRRLPNVQGLSIIDNEINHNRGNLSNYVNLELRVVECPFYDGRNPNYNEAKYREWVDTEKLKGIEFKYSNCPPELDSWTYADRTKVREWASIEPTVFIETLTPNEA